MDSYWSWVLTGVGLAGFYLAGRKVWWCWYVNIANQILWFAYAWLTEQWGFILGTFAYSFVFIKNAYAWTKEHLEEKRRKQSPSRGLLEVGAAIEEQWRNTLALQKDDDIDHIERHADGSLHAVKLDLDPEAFSKSIGKAMRSYEDEDGFHVDFRLDPDPEISHMRWYKSENPVCESPDEEDFVMHANPLGRHCDDCRTVLNKKNRPF